MDFVGVYNALRGDLKTFAFGAEEGVDDGGGHGDADDGFVDV